MPVTSAEAPPKETITKAAQTTASKAASSKANAPKSNATAIASDAMADETPMDALLDQQGQAFEAVAASNRVLLDGLTALNEEMMAFMAQRLRQDVDVSQKLFDCRTAQEVIDLESAFVRSAISDYFDEASRIFEMASITTRSSVEAMQAHSDKMMRSATQRKNGSGSA